MKNIFYFIIFFSLFFILNVISHSLFYENKKRKRNVKSIGASTFIPTLFTGMILVCAATILMTRYILKKKHEKKIIEKGSKIVAKSQSKKQLEKVLPKPIAKQVAKKIGKGVESLTSSAIDLWNKFKK